MKKHICTASGNQICWFCDPQVGRAHLKRRDRRQLVAALLDLINGSLDDNLSLTMKGVTLTFDHRCCAAAVLRNFA